MTPWEYEVRHMSGVDLHNGHNLDRMLDEMGKGGWELVDVRHVVTDASRPDLGYADYTFKRQKPQPLSRCGR